MNEENRGGALTLSLDEAAILLGVSRYSVYTRIKMNELPYIRVGRVYRIPKAKLLRMINGEDACSIGDNPARPLI